MTLLVLFITLSLLLIGAYLRFFRDPLSPAIILIVAYIFSIAIAIINIPVWHVDITPWTAVVLFSGLFIFVIGSLLAFTLKGGDGIRQLVAKDRGKILKVRTSVYIFSIIFMVLFVYLYNGYVNQAADSVVTRKLDTTSLELYRDAMVGGDIDEPMYITVMKTVGGALAMFYLLVFINNRVGTKTYQWRYVVPVILYCLTLILSSGRIGFIYLIITALVFFYLFRISFQGRTNNTRFMWTVMLGAVMIFASFLALGNLTNKTQQQDSLVQNISIYAGSSIVAFDDYLTNSDKSLVESGSETLPGVSNLLRRIGVDVGDSKSRFLEQRYIGDMTVRTNIYTSLRRLIADYGYIGMLLIQFISGYVITWLYVNIRKYKYNNMYFAILTYALLAQYIALSSTDERLVVNLLTISTILTILSYFALTRYGLIVGRGRTQRVKVAQ